MKIRGKTGISLKLTAAVGCVLFAFLTIIRFYHAFMLTDPSTGFFTDNNFTVIVMYALIIAGVIGIISLCYICGDLPTGEIKKKVSFPSAAAGFLFSIALFYDAFKSLKGADVFELEGASFSAIKEALGGAFGLLGVVFAVLGGIAILIETLYVASGKEIPAFLKLPMLFPVLWAFTETLGFFKVTVSYIKVSQLFFAIFSAAFLMLFLFQNARVSSGYGRKDAVWFFFATGIIAAGLSFAAGLPAVLASDKLVSYCSFEIYNIAGGLYCIAAMLRRAGVRAADENTDENVITETL